MYYRVTGINNHTIIESKTIRYLLANTSFKSGLEEFLRKHGLHYILDQLIPDRIALPYQDLLDTGVKMTISDSGNQWILEAVLEDSDEYIKYDWEHEILHS